MITRDVHQRGAGHENSANGHHHASGAVCVTGRGEQGGISTPGSRHLCCKSGIAGPREGACYGNGDTGQEYSH